MLITDSYSAQFYGDTMATPPLRLSDRELVSTQVDYSAQRKGGGFQNLILKGKEGPATPSSSATPSSQDPQPSSGSGSTTPPPASGSDLVTAQPVEQDAATVEIKRNRFKKRSTNSNQDSDRTRQGRRGEKDDPSPRNEESPSRGRRLSRKA